MGRSRWGAAGFWVDEAAAVQAAGPLGSGAVRRAPRVVAQAGRLREFQSHRLPRAYCINTKGLRDDETSYEKPPGGYRIALVGESLAFGAGVPIDQHFSKLLEGYFKDVEVVNLDVQGYGLDQELLRLESEGFRYAPDVVLVYVPPYRDHRHMHRRRFGLDKPRFILSGDQLILTGYPVKPPPPLGRLRTFLHETWRCLGKPRGTCGEMEEQRRQDQQDHRNPAFMEELDALGDRLLRHMNTISQQHGARFALVTRQTGLHERMRSQGISSLHVNQALNNSRLRLPNDPHANPCGNGVLAWVIAEFLIREALIPVHHPIDPGPGE